MKVFNKILFTGLLLITQLVAFAQGEVEMADTFRANGKIFVVVAIVLIVLAGLILYLFTMDRKLGKIEKQLSTRNKDIK